VLAVLTAGRNRAGVSLTHLLMLELAVEAHVRQQIVGADQHQVDAFHGDDLLCVVDSPRALELDDDHGGRIEGGVGLGGREGTVLQMRQAARRPALTQRRILHRGHHGASLFGRADVRGNHTQRPTIERTLDVVGRVGGHAHERRDTGLQRGHADLPRGIDRKARMLQVDIDGIEPCRLGDAHDLDATHQPHSDGGDDLAPRQLLLDVVAQNVAQLHRRVLLVGVDDTSLTLYPSHPLVNRAHRSRVLGTVAHRQHGRMQGGG
jgi:hypothetical protein